MDAGSLEAISDENWRDAASVLCKSAMFYETLLTKSLELLLRAGEREEVERLVEDHAEAIDLHAAVTRHWRQFLEIGEV